MPGWLIVTSWVAAALSFLILPEQQALAYSATSWCIIIRTLPQNDARSKISPKVGSSGACPWRPRPLSSIFPRRWDVSQQSRPSRHDGKGCISWERSRGTTSSATGSVPWKWGIFSYHHYHSTAWELLLCVQGQADILLGGDETGTMVTVETGDVMLIPPGVAHKQMREQGGFALLGSYPKEGCSGRVDTVRGKPNQQERQNILDCVAPKFSPILEMDLMQFYQ